jgi:hypothetical protein
MPVIAEQVDHEERADGCECDGGEFRAQQRCGQKAGWFGEQFLGERCPSQRSRSRRSLARQHSFQ